MYEITDEGIDGDHAFGLEFAEGDMNGPLVWTRGAQAVIGEIDAFADTHAGVAEQQEDISAEIVAAHELLLQELILLGGERSWQTLGRARNILAQQQVGQFGEMAGARPVHGRWCAERRAGRCRLPWPEAESAHADAAIHPRM